jgi:serine phosphatase RsbU (regulator of sigma subunit)
MPRHRDSAPVTIVAIDERALDARGQWPWPRTTVAELIRAVAAARPAAIGLDLLFVEPDRSAPGADGALAAALEGNKVVLGIAGLQVRDRRFPLPPHAAPVRLSSEGRLRLRRYDGHLQSRPEIDRSAAGRGLLSADSRDRIVRRVPLVARIGEVVVPALSLEMLRVVTRSPMLRIDGRGGQDVSIGVGPLSIPVQSNGAFNVYFGRHDPKRFVSAEDVLAGRADELLRDKLVLLGVTGLGLLDFQATPLGERIPGVEVHAQILEQAFDNVYLHRPTGASWSEAGLLAVAGLLLLAVVPAWRPVSSAAVLLALLALLAATGAAAFKAGVLLDVATPALGAVIAFTALLAATLAEADRQRRLLREAQARVAGELEAARRIQMGLLPAPQQIFSGERRFSLAALLEPARTVGGDFFDCFMLDRERLFFLVGDVSGKGLGASLFMALSKSLLKSIALRGEADPAQILARASAEISRDNREQLFVTAFVGVLDARNGRLSIANAGHEPPVLCQPGNAPRRLTGSAGPPLCVLSGYPYGTETVALAPGAWLCAVTDGVTEAMDGHGRMYGGDRMLAELTRHAAREPAALIEALREDVARFAAGAEPSDDLTLLCVRWNAAPSAR